MKTKTYLKNLLLLPVAIFMLIVNSVIAQDEVLEVLPSDGRNKLFFDYLMEEVDTLMVSRNVTVTKALISSGQIEFYQTQLKQDYLRLLGQLPEKTPLNAVVTDTIECDGYNIEKVHYQSLPDHHVTANLYIPTTGTGPYPGILMAMGHYGGGKSNNLLQSLCIFLAQKGFVTLIVDFIGYAERDQVISPATGSLAYTGESGTTEHSVMDVGSVMAGTSVVAHILWDNHRGIDYLFTRPEVDTNRIGCTGSSGGGGQATYLAAFDDRIKVTVIDSYIMKEQVLFSTIGPQTGSQNLSYEGLYGIDHPDYMTMFAPKPFLITASTQDFFDINATRQAYAEAQLIYDTLGAPEKIGFFEVNASHGLNGAKNEATVKWFRTWFYDDTTSYPNPEVDYLTNDTLTVSETGQVFTSFENEVTVTDLNIARADARASAREAFWLDNTRDSCLNMVRSLIRLNENTPEQVAESVDVIDRGNYTIDKIKITSGNHCPVTGLLFAPKANTEKLPAVLYVDGRGKKTDAGAGGLIEKVYVDSGKIVFAIDVRGFGETSDNPAYNDEKYRNKEHRNSVISLYVGKTLIGQRVEDIRKAMDYLITRSDVDPYNISIVGLDRAYTAVLHAAALDERYAEVTVRKADTSWMHIIENPTVAHNATHVVPSSILYYDLPDLVNAIAPRPVYYNPPDYVITSIENIFEDDNKSFVLSENYPNPFKNFTRISYTLHEPAHVMLIIYDHQGKEIQTLVNEHQHADRYDVSFQPEQPVSGIYFYQLIIDGEKTGTGKMIAF
ncbi:MAG: acetylxylan esterase [Bacteroidales bacterium]|nr:acetylxylan esterase [Bacteroidales bacterium]MBN2762885.1 acetylxylan esterase [Bacteroidales bacterium]